MIIRKVAIELTEKQYEKLCQMAASAGKTVEKVVQTSFHICQKKESLN